MSDQADRANKMIREKLGKKADEAAAALGPNLHVLPPTGDGGGEKGPKTVMQRLPGGIYLKSTFAREVGQVMAEEEMFQRDGVPVTVNDTSGRLESVSAQRLITELERWFVFFKLKPNGEDEPIRMQMSMQVDCARFLLEASEFTSRLRRIERVNRVRMPVRRKNGDVVLLPEGYDDESQIYTLKSDMVIDEEMPLDKAVNILRYRLKEFPFVDDRSRAVQICSMVSLFGTCLLRMETPRLGFVWRSNDRGGGKSLLAQMAIIPPFGLPQAQSITDKKMLKETLDSAALQSEPVLFFDNLEGVVKNQLLDSFMTTPSWSVRLFHTQKTVAAVPGTVLLFTGNNLSVSPDIGRRTLLCNLFVPEFDLQERRFENILEVGNLMQPEVRSEMLGALWSLVRNWRDMGFPVAGERKAPYRIASFGDWSDVFGGMVQAAGFGNPLVPPSDETSATTERVHQRRLVELLAARILPGEKRVVIREFKDIVDLCHENELFPWKMDGKTYEDKDSQTGEIRSEFKATNTTLAWLGRFMTEGVCGRESGREYSLPSKQRVRIGYTGRGRARHYWLELVG